LISKPKRINPKTLQVLLILLFAGLFLFLQSAPRKSSPKSLKDREITHSDISTKERIDLALSGLDQTEQNRAKSLISGLEKAMKEEKVLYLDSLIAFWDVKMKPDVSVLYYLEKAKTVNNFEIWMQAGNRAMNLSYFPNFEDKHWALHQAIDCFDNASKIDPDNIDAQIRKASALVDAGDNPMEGIGLLRALEESNPDNVEIIFQLARFSVQSGQYDKAIERYNRALEIAPNILETYFYLGEALALSGNKEQARKNFDKYISTVEDPFVANQLEEYVKEVLKN
jgi:tetratricopeptide (TPR) repeat protein